MPEIPGFAECWGITVLHCPYCHGYELRDEKTGILGNGQTGFELVKLISNWTNDLTLFSNGPSTLTVEQTSQLAQRKIKIVEKEIERLDHTSGKIQHTVFKDGSKTSLKALYARCPFEQHSQIPEALGCEITNEGYIKVNPSQETTLAGIFACGDNSNQMRTLANAVATGTAAGMTASK